MKILLIEDDKKIAEYLKEALSAEGFLVESAADGETGLALLRENKYYLLIADIMLPRLNGLDLIEQLRSEGNTLPVLILSAKSSLDDRVLGLQKGGDDYLVKPFALPELVARVNALLRRSSRAEEPITIKVGSLNMDLLSREVSVGANRLDLQAKEFSLLEFFVKNRGQVVSKTMILQKIWNYNFDPQTNVVDVLVCRLRNKLDYAGGKKMIQTVRGVGYIFKDV